MVVMKLSLTIKVNSLMSWIFGDKPDEQYDYENAIYRIKMNKAHVGDVELKKKFEKDLSSTSTKKKSITIDNGVSTSNISVSSYSDSSLSNAIDAGTLNFGLLQDTKEYQTLTSGAMAIYQIYSKNILTTDWSSLTIKPAQKDLTSLYLAIESLESSCSKLSTLKTNLQIVCKNVALDNYNTESVTYNYKKYLEGYSNFIGDTISASEAFEKVLTSVSTTSTETILPGAVKRLVATSVLYLTDFYYQKHFEPNKNSFNKIRYEQL